MNRLTLIIFGALGVLILYLWIDNQSLQQKVARGEDYESLYNAKSKEVKVWQDESGQWRNKSSVAQASASTLKDNPEVQEMKKEFSSIKKSLKNVESLTKTQAETISKLSGQVRDTIYMNSSSNDTIHAKKITAHNEWNDYDITVFGDSADIKRTGREEFNTAVYWERLTKKGNKTIWPFGKKEWSSEIVSKNPETKIVKQSVLLVKRKH
jgi:hypothetical protein